MCDHKKDLIEIQRAQIDSMTDSVVRWCPNCGAIVVDEEIDNRLRGQIMPMRWPLIVGHLNTLQT